MEAFGGATHALSVSLHAIRDTLVCEVSSAIRWISGTNLGCDFLAAPPSLGRLIEALSTQASVAGIGSLSTAMRREDGHTPKEINTRHPPGYIARGCSLREAPCPHSTLASCWGISDWRRVVGLTVNGSLLLSLHAACLSGVHRTVNASAQLQSQQDHSSQL